MWVYVVVFILGGMVGASVGVFVVAMLVSGSDYER